MKKRKQSAKEIALRDIGHSGVPKSLILAKPNSEFLPKQEIIPIDVLLKKLEDII